MACLDNLEALLIDRPQLTRGAELEQSPLDPHELAIVSGMERRVCLPVWARSPKAGEVPGRSFGAVLKTAHLP